MREFLSHLSCKVEWAHWNKYTGYTSASCVQRSNDSWFCNSHCISHSSCVLHRYGSQDIHRWKFKVMKQILKLGWISGDRGLIPLSLLTIPSSILSRLQKIWANNNRNYESGLPAEINLRGIIRRWILVTYLFSFIIAKRMSPPRSTAQHLSLGCTHTS
jgi:hypothetical protein